MEAERDTSLGESMKILLTITLMGPGVLIGFILGWLWWTFQIGIHGARDTLANLQDWASRDEKADGWRG